MEQYEYTDDQLISAYLAGDERAFSALVAKHTNMTYRLVYQMLRSEETADVVQEAWVKAWKNIRTYEMGKNFKTWLLTIARNTALDFLRRRQAIAFSAFETDESENVLTATLASEDISALEESILSEEKIKVMNALSRLSPNYRQVLALRYGEDMAFEEIGEILGKPMNTVKSQARRGLMELEKEMAKEMAPKIRKTT